MQYKHIPVMLKEVLEYLHPRIGDNFIDCTLGGGGYSLALARGVGSRGKVLAIDADILAINNARDKFKKINIKNIILVHDNFKNLSQIVSDYFPAKKKAVVAGIVFDLGLSSAQLADRSRGFSFQLDAPLNMAMGEPDSPRYRTDNIVNSWRQDELEKIFREYGEEKFARAIAKKIVFARRNKPIITTGELVKIINEAVPSSYRAGRIHPATKTFQALRIATNQELNNLDEALPAVAAALQPGGRIGVISYHSLEDRIVKNFFREESKDCFCPPEFPICRCGHKASLKIITKKIILPSEVEIKNNPRARSAKMRVAEKIK